METTEKRQSLYCSFCGKSEHDVQALVAGPSVFICDECIELADLTATQKIAKDAAIAELAGEMTPAVYLKESERTERKFPDGLVLSSFQAEVLHASMGMVTESGEMMDQLKKHLIYGAPIDDVNVAEEVGDTMWYIAIMCRYLDMPLEAIMTQNIEKLRKRFPDKFTEHDALHRDLDAERQSLEDHHFPDDQTVGNTVASVHKGKDGEPVVDDVGPDRLPRDDNRA